MRATTAILGATLTQQISSTGTLAPEDCEAALLLWLQNNSLLKLARALPKGTAGTDARCTKLPGSPQTSPKDSNLPSDSLEFVPP